VLYGAVNPSGHLPYTIAKEESDYSFAGITNSSALLNTTDPNAWQSDFKERLLIDYRHFDYYNLSVQYEFGFGLSYTTFSLSDVSITAADNGSSTTISAHCPPTPSTGANSTSSIPPPGGNPALWQTLYTVSALVTNTGSTAGSAVPQLYLNLPTPSNGDVTPLKVLRGFEKVLLQPGESKTVTFPLMRRDLSYWSVEVQGWVIGDGEVRVYAGFSSRDVRSESRFSVLG
jgi:beta-glucosidase